MTEEMAAIRRPFGPDELHSLLAAHGISHAVLVQTQSSVKETRDFLALAAATEFIAGVVGWVDLTDPRVSDTLAEVRAGIGGSYLVGARHQVHDESDPHWLLRDDVRAAACGCSRTLGSLSTFSCGRASSPPRSTRPVLSRS